MIFQYHAETDMLYIEFAPGISTESEEIIPGIVADFDENKRLIGIEFEDAGKFADLSRLEISSLPIADLIMRRPVESPIQIAA
jgi:uncharacterized protein YuzE